MKLFSTQQIRILVVAIGGFVTIAALQAAEPGVGEVSGFAGIASSGGNINGNFGGGLGANLGRFVHLFGEASYMPRATETFNVLQGTEQTKTTVSGRLMNYGGGIQFRIPTGAAKIEPYGLLAFGYVQVRDDVTATLGAAGTNYSSSDTRHNVYNAVGAGTRIFLGKNWGIKPEFRYYKRYALNLSSDDPVSDRSHAITFTTGIFYQFGGR
jgi:outer membrane protein with beta-barrel domain